jgi:imidazolonepropionase-like amidohydrolase
MIFGPRIFAAGRAVCQTGEPGDQHILRKEDAKSKGRLWAFGPDDCRRATREALQDGSDFIKIFTTGSVGSEKDHPKKSQFTIDEIKAITDEAHRAGKKVASHAEGTEGVKNAIIGGVDTIEHGFFLDKETVDLMIKNNVFFSPTIALLEVYKRSNESPFDMPVWRLRKQQECIEAIPKSFLLAYRSGVKIATGTDYSGAPMREHGDNADEPITMVKYGMSPIDAITASTLMGAETIGIEKEIGSLQKGKVADIIAVNGNPLEEITALKNVAFVMKEGETTTLRRFKELIFYVS